MNYTHLHIGELLCPICSESYLHLGAPEHIEGKDDYQARPYVRGDVIRIPFYCEDGHEGDMIFGFHKGETQIWLEYDKKKNDQITEELDKLYEDLDEL